jgi:hypothetical protein
VNWQHLQAFVWLRWRLFANQLQRGGTLNAVLMTILAVALTVLAVPLLIGCFVLGLFVFPKTEPIQLLFAWDGMVVAFLFFWIIGLMSELQRTDSLSLSKFMHLPLSLSGVFLINYLSSLVCVSLIVFAPILFGFALALIFAKGLLLLAALPLTLAFLLMITALTSQFQGWLASLMSNPRRRRTVVMIVTVVFIGIFQLPNLLNLYRPWGLEQAQERIQQSTKLMDELAALDREYQSQSPEPQEPAPPNEKPPHGQKVDPDERARRRQEQASRLQEQVNRHQDLVRRQQEHMRRRQEIMDKYQLATEQTGHSREQSWERTARFANAILPVGWLPLGVMIAAEGMIGPALLGMLGMTVIGTTSLWRAYRTTLRLYLGDFTSRKGAPKAADVRPVSTSKPAVPRMLEAVLPGVSEPVSAIALAGLRSLIRAPEAKMMLLTPVIFGAFFGSMVLKMPHDGPDSIRSLIAIGAIGIAMFGVLQLMSNQFGFDRDGFRLFVLCAAPRRDILLGKNLSFAPLAIVMAAILLTIVEVLRPLRVEHLLAMVPQFVSMYLLFCLLTNVISIYAAVPVAVGSLRPAKPKITAVILQMLMVTFLFPLSQLPTLLPLGIETALEWQKWTAGLPVCLLLTVAECAAVVFLYRFALDWQGDLLQAREQKILEIVTSREP